MPSSAGVPGNVRGRAPQMQSCYQREGLSRSPDLAGAVTLVVTIDRSGSVSAATIARRSWSGPGAAETEACMVNVARSWRFGAADESGTYEFPFSFSSGR